MHKVQIIIVIVSTMLPRSNEMQMCPNKLTCTGCFTGCFWHGRRSNTVIRDRDFDKIHTAPNESTFSQGLQKVILPRMRLGTRRSVLHFFSFLVYRPAGRSGGEWAGKALPTWPGVLKAPAYNHSYNLLRTTIRTRPFVQSFVQRSSYNLKQGIFLPWNIVMRLKLRQAHWKREHCDVVSFDMAP